MRTGKFLRTKRVWGKVVAGFIGAAVSIAAIPTDSDAAFLPWGNASGSNGVISWSNGGSTDGIWGDPVVTGLTLTFTPDEFRAEASNGGADTVDGLLSFDVDILGGNQITGFRIDEVGSYSVLGLGVVNATGVLIVTNREIPSQIFTDTMTPTVPFPLSNANPVGSISGIWGGTMEVPTVGLFPNGIDKVTIIVDNTLQASSGAGGTAFIDKKLAGSGVTISIFIPEPATLGLALLAAPLLLRRRA